MGSPSWTARQVKVLLPSLVTWSLRPTWQKGITAPSGLSSCEHPRLLTGTRYSGQEDRGCDRFAESNQSDFLCFYQKETMVASQDQYSCGCQDRVVFAEFTDYTRWMSKTIVLKASVLPWFLRDHTEKHKAVWELRWLWEELRATRCPRSRGL